MTEEGTISVKALAEALEQALAPVREEIASLKARVEQSKEQPKERKTQTHDSIKNAPEPVRTLLTDLSPKLAGLRGMVKKARANMADKCAAHSLEAIQTYRNAGGQAARAFIANGDHDAPINTADGDSFTIHVPCTERDIRTGMVPGSVLFQYAIALEQELGAVSGTPAGKARGRGHDSVTVTPNVPTDNSAVATRKRGRPKGSKNQPKKGISVQLEAQAKGQSELDKLNAELAQGLGIVE